MRCGQATVLTIRKSCTLQVLALGPQELFHPNLRKRLMVISSHFVSFKEISSESSSLRIFPKHPRGVPCHPCSGKDPHRFTKDLDFKCKEPKASQKKSREEMVREPRVDRCRQMSTAALNFAGSWSYFSGVIFLGKMGSFQDHFRLLGHLFGSSDEHFLP